MNVFYYQYFIDTFSMQMIEIPAFHYQIENCMFFPKSNINVRYVSTSFPQMEICNSNYSQVENNTWLACNRQIQHGRMS